MTRDPVQLVSEAMAKHGWARTGAVSWKTKLSNGAALPVAASLDDGWLRVEAEIPEIPEASPWSLLAEVSSFPPLVRLALARRAPRGSSLRLVSDLDTQESGTWPSRLLSVSENLLTAGSRLHDTEIDEREPEPESPVPGSVIEAIGEAGWACEARGEDGVEIPLDYAAGMGARARVHASDQGLRVFAPLRRDAGSGGDEGADATALFLLHAAHRLRAVRAVARVERGRSETAVGWEARLPLLPASDQIDRALHALAVACRHSMREVAALATPVLFRRYLHLLERGARPQTAAPLTKARPSR